MNSTFINLSSCLNLDTNLQHKRETGFESIDSEIGGFCAGELIVLAARPAMGKTAIALVTIGAIAINQKLPVVVFSMKHEKVTFAQRLLKALISHSFVKGNVPFNENKNRELIKSTKEQIRASQIYIDDSTSQEIEDIVSKCYEIYNSNNENLGLVVIDCFENLSPSFEHTNKIAHAVAVSKSLKILAQEIKCPIMITTTLSRRPEQREFKQPIHSDLKLHGALSKHADRLLLMYRPQAYDIDSKEPIRIVDGKNRKDFLYADIEDFVSQLYLIR